MIRRLSPGSGFMTLDALKKDVAAAIDAMRDELLSLSNAIHAEP